MNNEAYIINNRLMTALVVDTLRTREDTQAAEILQLVAEQVKDSQGRGPKEFLGGNGQTMGHQCSAKDSSDTFLMSDDLDFNHDEHEALEAVVESHQASIESNGQYNVRQLDAWRSGFDADKYHKRADKLRTKAAAHGVTIDKRRNLNKSDTRAADRAKLDAKKAKKLARLAARHG